MIGTVFKTQTGEITIRASKFELLSKSMIMFLTESNTIKDVIAFPLVKR